MIYEKNSGSKNLHLDYYKDTSRLFFYLTKLKKKIHDMNNKNVDINFHEHEAVSRIIFIR